MSICGFLNCIRLIVGLVGILGAVMCFGFAYYALTEIGDMTTFAISKKLINYQKVAKIPQAIDDPTPPEIKFYSGEPTKLSLVKKVDVKQGWMGKRCNWGNVEIYSADATTPVMTIEGVVNPHHFKQRLAFLIHNLNLPVSLQTSQPATNLVEIPLNRTQGQRLRIGVACLALSSISFAALLWVGGWYPATIKDWDYCIQNNLCFVCHQPASPAEFGPEDFCKNVRLCSEHSTGWQAWRWVVYGVPANMLIYEDAPMGTAKLFQHIMRWIIIAIWFLTLLACAAGAIVSLGQLFNPHTDFFLWLDLRG